jgi:hypothetical protein
MNLLKYPSLIVLIIANIVPLYGVYSLRWSTSELILLYWFESAIIGFFNVLKMALAQEASTHDPVSKLFAMAISTALKIFFIPFFILHYGGFMLGHLVFIIGLFIKDFSISLLITVAIGAISLFFSHAASFFLNYVRGKEYEKAVVPTLMFSPYGRIMLMHLTILMGAFVNAPVVILIVGKTLTDAFSHIKEHNQKI